MKYKRPKELVISVDATAPKDCWNIFREFCASTNPELTARDISKSFTKDQRSELQPFFENAANNINILFNPIMAMYEEEQKNGDTYSNWHFKYRIYQNSHCWNYHKHHFLV